MFQPKVRNVLVAAFLLSHILLLASAESIQDDDEAYIDNEQFDNLVSPPVAEEPPVVDDEVLYATPPPPVSSYIAETFDDIVAFEKTWVRSQAKKDGVDADIAMYDGVWKVEESLVPLLKGDRGLVLKSKAKHAAISAPLSRPYKFGAKPFVVQYEVTLQDGQECGGAYIKLLSAVDGKKIQLDQFQDKTPYTIMFGPDKCGNDYKLHFIFRHVNPLNGSIEEKHAKRPRDKLEESFKDKRPHLYTLVLRPDNTFEISLDHSIINSGHLLEDFTPSVNPEKEITDPNDRKPEDWDEKEKIPDPDDKKPEDWNDDAPKKIPDPNASIPSGWLENEPEMISDPEAVRPDDWDNDMDGEWEAPLINNPACAGAPGCGPWSRPSIDNPAYKGKWRPRLIDNPNYRGQWVPRMIANPNYFQDLEPFKMTPINAVGFELWSMSDNIYIDNVLITDSISDARQFAQETFDLKLNKLDRGKGGMIQQLLDYSNDRPWLYAIYVLIAAVPVVIIIMCCCTGSSEKNTGESQKERKKTDSPTEDDPVQEGGEEEDSKKDEGKSSQEEDEDEDDDEEENEDEEEDQEENGEKQEEEENEEDEEAKKTEEETASGSSPRPRRRARKD